MNREESRVKNSVGRRDFLKAAGMSAGLLALSPLSGSSLLWANAKEIYPAEKITMIIPYSVASGYDTWLRTFTPYVSKYLKELSPLAKGGDIHLRNEPAAAGQKGYSLIFNSKSEGYALGTFGTGAAIEALLNPEGKSDINFKKASFLLLGNTTVKTLVTSKNGFKSWGDVLESLKKGPVKMAVGTYGRFNHAAAIIMQDTMGLKFKLVPFPSTVESMNALVRGDVHLAMADEDSVTTLIDAKEIRPLINFTETSEYPGAVSTKELGFPELAFRFSGRRYLIAPPGLFQGPKKILLAALKKASDDKEYIVRAKKYKMRLAQVYGDDAEKDFLSYVKSFASQVPLIKKFLAD